MIDSGIIASALVAAVWIVVLVQYFRRDLSGGRRVPGTFPTDSDLEEQATSNAISPITFAYDPQRVRYVLRRLAFSTVAWSIVVLYFALRGPSIPERHPVVLIGVITLFLIFVLPDYLIFSRYKYISTSASVTIANGTRYIIVNAPGGHIRIPFDQLWTVARVGQERPLFGKVSRSALYHFVIETKDDRRIIITSLMTNLMQLPVSSFATEPRRGFAWISLRDGRVLNVANTTTRQ